MSDIYSLFSDVALMQDMVRRGAEKARGISRADADYLLGTSEEEPEDSKMTKPMHPCFMSPPDDSDDCPLVLFDCIDTTNTIELQYGTLVYLALDAEELDRTASASFPAAADFARTIPQIVEKSLLGTRHSASQIPVELIVKFVLMLMSLYNK